ncbi:hypothetical protein NE237_018218 [Protea cynaroides]|uniref:Uncharacterized protein n=1 Tax=Protea cynaroides TaxID=273540 RepID=A0A9Q0K9I9_9MAGN|nr:hypothetical protein NE237_018218 [Protea cynaroides]
MEDQNWEGLDVGRFQATGPGPARTGRKSKASPLPLALKIDAGPSEVVFALSRMSRCFPYPPPGYERKSGALDEALINSIKKESENVKKERKKERKREKEDKKREKKERERLKTREKVGVEEKKQKHEKRHKNEKSKVEHEGGDHPRSKEAEQFEKSSLTEEHGQPIGSQNLNDSSDSTQNSHKRKKPSSPSDSSHNHGSILRIRLIQKDQEIILGKELPGSNYAKTDRISQCKNEIPPRLSEVPPCSASERATSSNYAKTDRIAQWKNEIPPRLSEVPPCSASERATLVMQERCEDVQTPIEKQTCSTSGRTDVQTLDIAENARRSSSKLKKLESQYRDLIINWVPPIIENYSTDLDDEEWLFERQSKPERESKRFKPSNDGLCQGSSSLCPRACYLPEADIYALPYTLPF